MTNEASYEIIAIYIRNSKKGADDFHRYVYGERETNLFPAGTKVEEMEAYANDLSDNDSQNDWRLWTYERAI